MGAKITRAAATVARTVQVPVALEEKSGLSTAHTLRQGFSFQVCMSSMFGSGGPKMPCIGVNS